jgi:hypothetical protein
LRSMWLQGLALRLAPMPKSSLPILARGIWVWTNFWTVWQWRLSRNLNWQHRNKLQKMERATWMERLRWTACSWCICPSARLMRTCNPLSFSQSRQVLKVHWMLRRRNWTRRKTVLKKESRGPELWILPWPE